MSKAKDEYQLEIIKASKKADFRQIGKIIDYVSELEADIKSLIFTNNLLIKRCDNLEAEKAELIDVVNTIGSLLDDDEIAQAQAVTRYAILKAKRVVL